MSIGMGARVSRKLSNCKKVGRAGDLKSRDGSMQHRKGRKAGDKGTGSERAEYEEE